MTTLSNAQKDYLNILTPFLEKACHSPNTFNPHSANIVGLAIETVNEKCNPKDALKLFDILSVYFQAIGVGQKEGCFTVQDVRGYWGAYSLLEQDLKQLEASTKVPTNTPETVSDKEDVEKIQEIGDEEALKISLEKKIKELEQELKNLK